MNKWSAVRGLVNIRQRCGNPNDPKFKYYGGKGIKCLLSTKDLLLLYRRDGGEKMRQPSIGRIDHNKNYCVDNCKFLEMEENRSGRLAHDYKIDFDSLNDFVKKHGSQERAAWALKVSFVTFNRWMTKKTRPNMRAIKRLKKQGIKITKEVH